VRDALIDLLHRQRSGGFPDLRGAEASATIPIADRLINELIWNALPKDRPVHDLQIHAEAGDRLTLRVQLSGSALLPTLSVTLAIDEQPALPQRPVLTLRVLGIPKLLMLAGGLGRVRDALPPGVTIEAERILLNLDAMLKHQGQADLLQYLTSLTVSTRDNVVVVAIRARI
jgi:hypothetical protein